MINEYWHIVEKNINSLEQQMYVWCNNKGIPFLKDDFHQALLQVGEGILKGYWKKEMNYNNIKNYLFITFRNINYQKLNDINTDSIDSTIYENVTILESISVEDEEYEENDYIEIEKVFKFIINNFGEDKLEGFKNKLLHKHSSLSKNEYMHILWAVRHHFYPKVDKWYGDLEKCQDNKNKMKQWRLNNPTATRKEYLEYYLDLNYEIIKSHNKDYYHCNKEKTKLYYENNKEYFREYYKRKWLEKKKYNNGIYNEE